MPNGSSPLAWAPPPWRSRPTTWPWSPTQMRCCSSSRRPPRRCRPQPDRSLHLSLSRAGHRAHLRGHLPGSRRPGLCLHLRLDSRSRNDEHRVTRVQGAAAQRRAAAGPVPGRGLPGPVGRTDPQHRPGGLGAGITSETDEQRRWDWAGFRALPSEQVTVDLHCVTHWSKLGTTWEGVSLDTLLEGLETSASFALVSSYGGYTTNLPLEDLTDGKAWIAFRYDGEELEPEHGG